MAHALATGIRRARPQVSFIAADPDPARLQLMAGLGTTAAADNQAAAAASDVVFLAVKPQVAQTVCDELFGFAGLIVSIVAGVSLASLESWMPQARVVRVMPNTPALVLRMAAAYTPGRRTSAEDLTTVGELLSTAGLAVRVAESDLDAVTGLSGSGPAFMARVFEAFIQAGVKEGLEPQTARSLTLQTALGTAQLLLDRDLSPQELVDLVSSPNGTTVAGRAVLEESGFAGIVGLTVAAAAARSRELGKAQ